MLEAAPHKGALEAGDEIRGLLEGSRQVNAKKGGVGALPAVSNAAQVSRWGSWVQGGSRAAACAAPAQWVAFLLDAPACHLHT